MAYDPAAPAAKRSRNVGFVFASGTSHPPGRDVRYVVQAGDAGARRFFFWLLTQHSAFALMRLPETVQARDRSEICSEARLSQQHTRLRTSTYVRRWT